MTIFRKLQISLFGSGKWLWILNCCGIA